MNVNPETNLMNRIMLEISNLRIGGERAAMPWRQQVGTFRALRSDAIVKVGETGMSDVGLVMRGGKVGQFEIKLPSRRGHKNGGASEEQLTWGRVISELGGVFRVIYTVDEALRAVEESVAV